MWCRSRSTCSIGNTLPKSKQSRAHACQPLGSIAARRSCGPVQANAEDERRTVKPDYEIPRAALKTIGIVLGGPSAHQAAVAGLLDCLSDGLLS